MGTANMTADSSRRGTERGALSGDAAVRSHTGPLRTLAIAVGIGWSVLFVLVGLRYRLQMYGDGSIFSYAVAVEDAWAFHWHNIPGRLFVYLFCFVPSESYVALTADARGGIDIYGFMFFSAPLLGLAATFAADRSRGRVIFSYACLSTACLCPLVFGFPTEMWMAHALFWPSLAVAHYGRRGIGGFALVLVMLISLVLTHEGALILASAILLTLLLRGVRDAAFLRTVGAVLIAVSVWAAVKVIFPPDDYFASILPAAALNFIDVDNLIDPFFLLLIGAVVSYVAMFLVVRRLVPANAHEVAAAVVIMALAIYWLWFDRALHTDHRYYLRTVLLIFTPVFGLLAAVSALSGEGRISHLAAVMPPALLTKLVAVLRGAPAARAGIGALLLVTLIHAVETAKFVSAWTHYRAAVRTLAMGTASDPALGDARFVSSARIGTALNRLSWSSTTQFLSVLVAPRFAPARLVVDPKEDYFWLSCKTATANRQADRAVPEQSRTLIRVHACLHR